MKTFSLTTFVWLCVLLSISHAQSGQPTVRETFKDWTTIRISFSAHGSDYSLPGKFILLQRLDSERVILSSSNGAKRSHGLLPTARAIITPDAAQKIVDQAVGFLHQAQEETRVQDQVKALPRSERGDPIKRHNPAGEVYYIGMNVLIDQSTYDYSEDFADDSTATAAFAKLIDSESTRKAP